MREYGNLFLQKVSICCAWSKLDSVLDSAGYAFDTENVEGVHRFLTR